MALGRVIRVSSIALWVGLLVTASGVVGGSVAMADGAGCRGACGNRRADAAGWCGNCVDHCSGGTEAQCAASCGDPWDEGPCLRQADQNVRQCYEGCRGNRACEGNCGGQYKRDQIQHCHDDKKRADDRRQGCLNACGGQKDCRASWCTEEGANRRACYQQVEEALAACQASCEKPAENCSEEKCFGVVRYATCGGKKKATGFCVSFRWSF